MYQGYTSLPHIFFSYICSILHSTGNTGTSYEVLNTFIWGREDPLPVSLRTVPLPEVPDKGSVLSYVLLLC